MSTADPVPRVPPVHPVAQPGRSQVLEDLPHVRGPQQLPAVGQGGQPAAPGDGLGHAAPGHGSHIGHDERDGISGAVLSGEVYRLARAHLGVAGHHEHIGVGQFVRRAGILEKTHWDGLSIYSGGAV